MWYEEQMKQQRRFLGKSFCSAAGEARRPTTNGYGPEGAGFMPPEDSAGTNGKRHQGGRAPSPAGNNVLTIHLFNQGPDCLPDAPSSVSARPPHTAL